MRNSDKIEQILSRVKDKEGLLDYLLPFMFDERSVRFDEILENRTRHFSVAIEDVYTERNAAAILRSCDCFGIQDVSIIERNNKYEIAEDIAMGSEKWVDTMIYDGDGDNSETCINDLKSKGYRIIATSPHKKENSIDKFDIRQKSVIFMGGERDGLSQTAMEMADDFIYIPIVGFTESFNISVAAAIILFDITNKLRASDIDWQLTDTEKLDLKLKWTIKTIASAEQLIKKFILGQ